MWGASGTKVLNFVVCGLVVCGFVVLWFCGFVVCDAGFTTCLFFLRRRLASLGFTLNQASLGLGLNVGIA
jgi:hypothetical protein